MAKNKTRLELTWIGKENRPKLEPRILIEDPEKSYHAAHRVSEGDIFDNRLIFGDNLLALKALEQEFAGMINCIYIDPPYNTGAAFEHYDDGVEHSLWLSLMRRRLEIIYRLLSSDGSLWINIDDNECHYLKIMCDEVFGRQNFVGSIIWEKADSPRNSARRFSTDHDYILVFSRDPSWVPRRLPRTDEANSIYENPDNDPRGDWLPGDPYANKPYSRGQYQIQGPTGRVFQPPPGRFWRVSEERLRELDAEGRIWWGPTGNARPSIKRYLSEVADLVPRTLWSKRQVGSNRTSKNEMRALFPGASSFATPKPEKLIARILQIATNPGDWVLDSFAGSGTTGAVAQKMGRRWIMVELEDTCHTHVIPRMQKVIDGEDQGGVSQIRRLVWEAKLTASKLKDASKVLEEAKGAEDDVSGEYEKFEQAIEDSHLRVYGIVPPSGRPLGGGFRYYTLGPTLIVEDEWGNPVINPDFNAGMLAEAMCKLEGFKFDPDPEVYWQQGRSSETDFIYVTTQFMSKAMLTHLSDEVGPNRSLLICCSAFRCDVKQFENLTVKKIPKAVLKKCEWGHDDYSLEIENLPDAPPEVVQQREAEAAEAGQPARKFGKDRAKDKGPTLFDMDAVAAKGGK
jgi:adenine-specific DNA-methyltransferase